MNVSGDTFQGKQVIACQFENTYHFEEGWVAVQTDKYLDRHYGYIYANRNWVIRPMSGSE